MSRRVKTFHVMWEIEVDAENFRAAAEEAADIQAEQTSFGESGVFSVRHGDEVRLIDLADPKDV